MRGALLTITALAFALLPANAHDGFKSLHLVDKDHFCLILPASKMDIGRSEDSEGGAGSYCTNPMREGQRQLPAGIWKNGGPYVTTGHGHGDYIQLTGTFDANKVPVLNPHDAGGGGQYDSNGGDGGHGNPADSHCKGYSSYVEIIEPDGTNSLACLRCCRDNADCPVTHDTSGCRELIPGQY